jgi:predicted metal-dependent hydrolase
VRVARYLAGMEETPEVEVRRSRRRRRTVSAYREADGRIVVLLPARLTRAQEAEWVETMVAKVHRSEARRKPSDDKLLTRASQLSSKYLEGLARPASVRWADNQLTRWGSCTPRDRTIRLSTRLQGMPGWVVDYVLVHELAHLLEHGHNERFWRLVERFPRTERARGFLEGVECAARGLGESSPTEDTGAGEGDELGEVAHGEVVDGPPSQR